jgi:hypothetical protein
MRTITTRTITAVITAVLGAVLLLAGCSPQQACANHGGLSGYANGWAHCKDGTWQKATGN